MADDKVRCQCCEKMMVPTVIKSRGLYVGWQWGGFLGGGRPVSNCCPFCLSEEWDGKADFRSGMLYKHFAFGLSVLCFFLILGTIFKLNVIYGLNIPGIVLLPMPFVGAIVSYKWFTKI